MGLLDICRQRTSAPQTNSSDTGNASGNGTPLEVVAADAVNLPIRSGIFDAAISIAVLHHISSEVSSLLSVCSLHSPSVSDCALTLRHGVKN